jgi:hypothetical protein
MEDLVRELSARYAGSDFKTNWIHIASAVVGYNRDNGPNRWTFVIISEDARPAFASGSRIVLIWWEKKGSTITRVTIN